MSPNTALAQIRPVTTVRSNACIRRLRIGSSRCGNSILWWEVMSIGRKALRRVRHSAKGTEYQVAYTDFIETPGVSCDEMVTEPDAKCQGFSRVTAPTNYGRPSVLNA